MVTIRLARHGGKKRPFYHVTVAEKRTRRDGRFIERLGFYNPLARGQEEELRINLERVDYWLSVGAQPTERTRQLVTKLRRQLTATEEQPTATADKEQLVATADKEPVVATADKEPSVATADKEPLVATADKEPPAATADKEPPAATVE